MYLFVLVPVLHFVTFYLPQPSIPTNNRQSHTINTKYCYLFKITVSMKLHVSAHEPSSGLQILYN